MIEISCSSEGVVSDFCEADFVVSDCIAELGNSLTGGFGYLLAATIITVFAFRLNFPSKFFTLPAFLLSFSISTAIFHVNLSAAASFTGTYSLYGFFFALNIMLIQANPDYTTWKPYAAISTYAAGSILGDWLIYHIDGIRSIDGMFSFGYMLSAVYFLFKFQKALPEHRTKFFTIRTLALTQVLILCKLVELLVPCSIDIIGACRWIWHLTSAFVAFYASVCVGLILLETNGGLDDRAMEFMLKNCPFIPRSLRDIYYSECLDDLRDEASMVAANLDVEIMEDITEHPDMKFSKGDTIDDMPVPETMNDFDVSQAEADHIAAQESRAVSEANDFAAQNDVIQMRVPNADDLSDIVTEIDQELDQIEDFLLSITS